jgi:hypothetical protein
VVLSAQYALLILASALASFWATGAAAQVDLLSADTLHGVVDLRAAAADGEPSFTTFGFGKLRYGGGSDGDYDPKAQMALAALEWTPRLSWDWSAVVDAGHQPGQENWFDLYQAYLVFKPVPHASTRFRARIGYFYPPISLENDARVWGVTNTITPSAINSWIGEEVKVGGVEATVSHHFGDQELAVTGALYGVDDTAGAILAYRGWSLDDQQSQAFGNFNLPPLSPFLSHLQQDQTYSALEIDDRVGYYAMLEWQPPIPLMLQLFHYDNEGNGTSKTIDQQWAWATQFTDVGATGQIDAHTRLLAQALEGDTRIGPKDAPLVRTGFKSAYLLASHDLGADTLTARGEVFETEDEAPQPPASLGERGWALTGAWRHPITKRLDLRLEAVHVDSDRPSRVIAAEAPDQSQTLFQSSLRLTF